MHIIDAQLTVIALARAMRETSGNLLPLHGNFPGYPASIVRNMSDGASACHGAMVQAVEPQDALDAATTRAATKTTLRQA